MNKYYMLPALVVAISISVSGGSVHSPVFEVDTMILVSQVSSPPFGCATDQLNAGETSHVFSATTDLLQDSQVSALFLCNSQSPVYDSLRFLADTHSVLIDSDGNGLPNIWEMIYFDTPTNTVATNDDDGDGEDNISEYIAGTNPKDTGSVFAVHLSGDAYYVGWFSVLNRLYTVQYTTNLSFPFGDMVDYVDVPGSDEMAYYLNYSTDEHGFYRVKVRIND